MHDRLEIIRAWRTSRDPRQRRQLHLSAVDIITDGALPFDLLDEAEELERDAYLAFLAGTLADGLVRYLDWWMLNDAPSIEEWRTACAQSDISDVGDGR